MAKKNDPQLPGMTEGTYLALVSRAAEIANNMIMDKDVEAP